MTNSPTSESRDSGGQPAQRALYGRRKGRPLRPLRQALVERLLPTFEIEASKIEAGLDPASIFGSKSGDIWLEIGFGAGEHLAWQATAHPDIHFIGCEPYINGVARLLSEIDENNLSNIRIYRDDARLLISRLPDCCISRAFILFPDPWPKARHNKRRIIGPATLPHLARILRDGAELRVATDDSGYKCWILQYVLSSEAFEWTARSPSDWRTRTVDWPPTRYEVKAIAAQRSGAFFRFVRRPRNV